MLKHAQRFRAFASRIQNRETGPIVTKQTGRGVFYMILSETKAWSNALKAL